MAKKVKTKGQKTLGDRIRSIRGDMRQTEFAEMINIKQAMVSRYEANKETPSPRILLRMAMVSKKSMEWLLTGRDRSSGKEKMSMDELIDLVLQDIHGERLPDAKQFNEMLRDVLKSPRRRKQMLAYYRFLLFEEGKK